MQYKDWVTINDFNLRECLTDEGDFVKIEVWDFDYDHILFEINHKPAAHENLYDILTAYETGKVHGKKRRRMGC